jgi:hypothetical protein
VLAKELAYYRDHFREAVQKDGVICLECGAICIRGVAQGKPRTPSNTTREGTETIAQMLLTALAPAAVTAVNE